LPEPVRESAKAQHPQKKTKPNPKEPAASTIVCCSHEDPAVQPAAKCGEHREGASRNRRTHAHSIGSSG
jgi:hypothetical protein